MQKMSVDRALMVSPGRPCLSCEVWKPVTLRILALYASAAGRQSAANAPGE